ncbi:hypothetical protein BC835DRAFT_121922 [Cytidiella melzeri]|nr:hypothetical protein BC835DRAFT_121922 [Cytidiella melzeri]
MTHATARIVSSTRFKTAGFWRPQTISDNGDGARRQERGKRYRTGEAGVIVSATDRRSGTTEGATSIGGIDRESSLLVASEFRAR